MSGERRAAPRRLLAALAASAVSTLIAAGAAEAVVRFALRDITTTADNRSYFAMKWKRDRVRLNALGFREREVREGRRPGSYRIAMIGDSYAFGQGIALEDRMSDVLEAELRGGAKDVDVLNFSRTGWNTADEAAVLPDTVRHARPDFVLLQWFVNDVEIRAPQERPAAAANPSALQRVKRAIRNNSALYFLASTAWHHATESWETSYTESMRRRFADPGSPDSRRADEALAGFFAACREHAVRCGVVLVPQLLPLGGERYPFGYLHDRVIARCRAEDVPFVDLRAPFAPFMNEARHRELWVNRFDPHMSPLANRLAAAAILDTFRPLWLAQ